MQIVMAVVIVAVLGGIFGFALSWAEKKLAVKKNEKEAAIEAMMPGANCGGCGFAGCTAYADAVANGEAQIGLCNPGGKDLAAKMSAIMGQAVSDVEKKRQVAHVFCKGDCKVTGQEYKYEGLQDCNAAALLFGGTNACKSGCMHLGSCIAVCPVGAISKNSEGHIIVDESKCIACGKCVKTCPTGAIRLMNADAPYVVDCSSHEKGAAVRKQCSVGCIGCGICEKKFPESGFVVDNFLSSFDPDKPHGQAEEAMAACPAKVISGHKGL
jgi:electron transport complex protein RnfB